MRLEFLSPDAVRAGERFAPLASSPMERSALAAGARLEVRDGWRVASGYAGAEREREACATTAGWADVSHLGKLELQSSREYLAEIVAAGAGEPVALELGRATRAAGAWWCPLTAERVLVVCEAGDVAGLRGRLEDAAAVAAEPASVVEVTTAFAALTVLGPLSREVLARLTALDLRPGSTPLRGFRPGSVARAPAMVLREGRDRFLVLFGAALGQYLWTVVADAAEHLGGAPVGLDALAEVEEPIEEVLSGA